MAKANPLFEKALAAEGISGQLADVARSIYMQESGGGRNTKNSNQGHAPEVQAHGGMQILPGTFRSVADKGWDINNPEQNARAGIRYLVQMDKLGGGDPRLAAAGYYGGPGGLEKARRGVAVSDPRNPKAPNTLQYADEVVARIGGAGEKNRRGVAPVQLAAAVPAKPQPVAAQPVVMAGAGVVPPDFVNTMATPEPQQAIAAMPAEVAPVVQAAAPVPVSNQAESAWMDFQQNLAQRQKIQADALAAYGKGVPANPIRVVDPAAPFMPVQTAGTQADFRAFGRWGARA